MTAFGRAVSLYCACHPHIAGRPWTETELSAAISLQKSTGQKRVLPLILYGKDEVLSQYPILAHTAYREYKMGRHNIAADLAGIVEKAAQQSRIQVYIENPNAGKTYELTTSTRTTVRWLAERAMEMLDVEDKLERRNAAGVVGMTFYIRFVLVDTRVLADWERLTRDEQRVCHCLLRDSTGKTRFITKAHKRLEEIGLQSGTTFNLYPVDDEHRPFVPVAAL